MKIGKSGVPSFVLTRNPRLASTVSGLYRGVAKMGIPGISPIALREAALLDGGFYTGAQLAKMAATQGFSVENPFDVKIRVGTLVGENSVIGSGTVITGKHVCLGPNTIISGTTIEGNNITLGNANELRNVVIKQGNITIVDGNVFNGTQIFPQTGNHMDANLSIGNNNVFGRTNIHNETGGTIDIGSNNQFGDNGQIRSVFAGNIHIGNWNSLMMDGGGVISTSYNFGNHWGGDIVIGYGVATKRGAELLGFGAYGITGEMMKRALIEGGFGGSYEIDALDFGNINNVKSVLEEKIVKGTPEDVLRVLASIRATIWIPNDKPSGSTVLIVGAAKPKASIIMGETDRTTEIRDSARIQHSAIMPGTDVYEGCKVYFELVDGGRVEAHTSRIGPNVPNEKDPGYPDSWAKYFEAK